MSILFSFHRITECHITPREHLDLNIVTLDFQLVDIDGQVHTFEFYASPNSPFWHDIRRQVAERKAKKAEDTPHEESLDEDF